MFVDNERYAGYNPEFLRRVQRSRKLERQKALIAEAQEARARHEREERIVREEYTRAWALKAEAAAQEREERIERAKGLEGAAELTAKQIIAYVAASNGLTFDEIVGPSRTKKLVVARHIAMATVRARKPNLSLPQIGRLFNRDHTTVIHAIRKAEPVTLPYVSIQR